MSPRRGAECRAKRGAQRSVIPFVEEGFAFFNKLKPREAFASRGRFVVLGSAEDVAQVLQQTGGVEAAVNCIYDHALLERVAYADDLADLAGDRLGKTAVRLEAHGQHQQVAVYLLTAAV